MFIVYQNLSQGTPLNSRNPWNNPSFFSDTLLAELNRAYLGLEWALTSPPKPHAFVSLPLQSIAKPICN